MSESNLTTQLGARYMQEFMAGALILDGDRVVMLGRPRSEALLSMNYIDLNHPDVGWHDGTLAASRLKTFNDMAWPKLGYRNFANDKVGNFVGYLTANRTVFRGLRDDQLMMEPMKFYATLGFSVWEFGDYASTPRKLAQIFRPKWFTYTEGMEGIRENKWPAFALNEDVAIALSFDQGAGRFCDIFFRGAVVGQITENGEILIANKVMKRSNLKKLYAVLES